MPIETSVLVTKYTWLIPALLELASMDVVRRREFTRIMSVEISKDLARSILWTLSKLGLIEKGYEEGTYKITPELRKHADNVRKHIVTVRKHRMLVLFGGLYYLVTVRKEKITVRFVSEELVRRVRDLLAEGPRSVKELVDMIGEKADRVNTALRVLELLGLIEKDRIEQEGRVIYRLRSATDPSLISRS